MNPDDQSFSEAIATIISQDETRGEFGSGFLIHKDNEATYWLTCAHVILDVGGSQNAKLDGQPVQLFHPIEQDLLSAKKGRDLAILRIQGFLEREPLKLCVASTEGKRITIRGHYQKAGSKFLESIEGSLVKSLQGNENGDRTKAWKLEISHLTKDTLQPGYSGSPVVDQTTGYVIGVVTQREGDKQGIAIDIESIEMIVSEKLSLQFSKLDNLSNSLQSNLRKSQEFSNEFHKLKQELRNHYSEKEKIEYSIQKIEAKILNLREKIEDNDTDSDRMRLLQILEKQRELAKKYGNLSINKFSSSLVEELKLNPRDSAHYFQDLQTCINRLYWVVKFNKPGPVDNIPLKLPLSNRSRYNSTLVADAYEELLTLLEKGLTQSISGESKKILLIALGRIREQFQLSL